MIAPASFKLDFSITKRFFAIYSAYEYRAFQCCLNSDYLTSFPLLVLAIT
jgi:hypothetical protein